MAFDVTLRDPGSGFDVPLADSGVDKSGSDSTEISSSETSAVFISVSTSDSTQISSSETSSAVELVYVTSSDSTVIGGYVSAQNIPSSASVFNEEETFEGGTTGAAITTGTIFDSVGGSLATTEVNGPLHGSKHGEMNAVSASSAGRINFSTLESIVYIRAYMRFSSFSSGTNTSVITFYDTTSTTTVRASMQIMDTTPTNGMRIRNGTSTVDTSSTSFSDNTWYRIEYSINNTGSTQELRIWGGATIESADTADCIEILTGTYNSGTTGRFALGPIATPGETVLTRVDSVAWSDTGWIGPYGGAAGNNIYESVEDSTEISSSETSSVVISVSTSDSTDISSTESSAFATVSVTGSDSTDISSTESSSITVAVTASDSTILTGTDATSTIIVSTTASDSTVVTGTDATGTLLPMATASDTTDLTGTDASSTIAVSLTTSDSTDIGSAETSATFVARTGTDSTIVTGDETLYWVSPDDDDETFENGSDGASITTGNTNFEIVSGGGNFTFDSANALHGSLGGKVDSTGGSIRGKFRAKGRQTKTYFSGYFKFTGFTNNVKFVELETLPVSNNGVANLWLKQTSGKIEVRNALDGTGTQTATGMTIGTWYRLDFMVDCANNTAELRVYSGANLEATGASYNEHVTIALTEPYIERIMAGHTTSVADVMYMDSLAYSITDWPAPRGSVPESSSDSTVISTTDSGSITLVSVDRSDSTDIGSSETSAFATVAVAGTDSTDISSSEVSAVMVPVTASDGTDISTSEGHDIEVSGSVDSSASDSTIISSTASSAVAVVISASDSTDTASSESSAFATVAVTGTDSTSITVTETDTTQAGVTGTDSTIVSSSETSAITVIITTSDSTIISSSESSSVYSDTLLIRYHERFNGGSNGTSITSGNSLFTLFPGTGTMEFNSDHPMQGGTGGKFVSTNAAQGKRGKIEGLPSRRIWYARFYYYKTGNPSVVDRFVIFETAANAVPPGDDIAGIREEANGNLTLFNGSSWVTANPITSPATGWHRIELKIDRDGALSTLRIWSGANAQSSGTADQEIQVALTDNGNEISVFGIGNYNAANQTRYIDDFAAGDEDWIGPSANIDIETTDSTIISSSESDVTTASITATDSTDISSTETDTTMVSISATDSTVITGDESPTADTASVTGTDSTLISSSDVSATTNQNISIDITDISSAETTSTTASLIASDTTDITGVDVVNQTLVTPVATDSTEIGSTESPEIISSVEASDSTEIGSSESTDIDGDGDVPTSASDSTIISTVETSTRDVWVDTSDSTVISTTESSARVAQTTEDATELTGTDASVLGTALTPYIVASANNNSGTGNASNVTVTIPASATVYHIAYLAVSVNTASNYTGPSGWALVTSENNQNAVYTKVFRKAIVSGDASSTVSFSPTGVGQKWAVNLVIVGNDVGVNTFTSWTGTSGTAFTYDTVTPTANNAMLLGFEAARITSTGSYSVTQPTNRWEEIGDTSMNASASPSMQASSAFRNRYGGSGQATTSDTNGVISASAAQRNAFVLAISGGLVTITSDSTVVSTTESSSTQCPITASDSTVISTSEDKELDVSGTVNVVDFDTGPMDSADSSQSPLVGISSNDTTGLSTTEQSAFATVDVTSADPTEITITEGFDLFSVQTTSDSSEIAAIETSSIDAVGTEREASDETEIGSIETSSIGMQITSSDITDIVSIDHVLNKQTNVAKEISSSTTTGPPIINTTTATSGKTGHQGSIGSRTGSS